MTGQAESGEVNTARLELLSLARLHLPHDDDERRHQLAIIDWLSACKSDPFDRSSFDPGHATGSCFVVSSEGRAALIFHRNLRLWVQPGGHAEGGERDPALVSLREAEEELGISLGQAPPDLFDLDVHLIAPRGEEPAHRHFDFRHLAVVDPAALKPATDAVEARWVTRGEIAKIGVDPGLRRMADKAVARGLLAA